jgi:hypothetical protein
LILRFRRQRLVALLEQERIEPAAVIDGLDRVRADPETHIAVEDVAAHRHVAQVRQEPALGLDVRMAHLVADKHRLASEVATP